MSSEKFRERLLSCISVRLAVDKRLSIREYIGSMWIPWKESLEYKYAAMDANGMWFLYKTKPFCNQGGKVWSAGECVRISPDIPFRLKDRINSDNWRNCIIERDIGVSQKDVDQYIENYPVYGGYFIGDPEPEKPSLEDIVVWECLIKVKKTLRKHHYMTKEERINGHPVSSQWKCARGKI